MKITVIQGQSHQGSTYHIAHKLAEKLGGEITKFQGFRILLRYGVGVREVSWERVSGKIKKRVEKKTTALAERSGSAGAGNGRRSRPGCFSM